MEKWRVLWYAEKNNKGVDRMRALTKASFTDAVTPREEENRALAYQAACEGIVLLKNEGVLPLAHKKLALFGAGAAHTVKGGTGSGEVNERYSVSILQGLEDRGYQITSRRWLGDYEAIYEEKYAAFQKTRREFWKRIGSKAMIDLMMASFQLPAGRAVMPPDVTESETDTCVYVLSRQAGEGGDRRAEPGDYYLTPTEVESIRRCAESYAAFVLIINCGSSLDLSPLDEIPGIGAILYICQLGTEGGHAVADVLSGTVTPSGKLTDTWARTYDDIPFAREYSYLNGNLQNEFYREDIYVGYRYFDSFQVAPRYPFGFGLSYADFRIKDLSVQLDGTKVTVRAEVRNRSRRFAGKETVQLYVSPPRGNLMKEWQQLAAFSKTRLLEPDRRQNLRLEFDLRDLASYDVEKARFVLDAGEYVLRLGNSSRNTTPIGVLVLKKDLVVSRHENICPRREPLQELQTSARPVGSTAGLPRYPVDTEGVEPICHRYETPAVCQDPRVRALLDSMTLEEMADVVVGVGMFGAKNRFDLPGSVGNTTSRFWDRGLVNVALCDGPAGLRIQKISAMDQNGKIRPLTMSISVMELLPSVIQRMQLGDAEKDTCLYQYATAFPVATALAQTWNEELLYAFGQAIYEEMKEFGCTFWLAPAMNIHRNPLCGRNFEYFSEDPLLTGKLAAAVCRGVQQEEGYYATIKHFACNNQEDGRSKVSSVVTERALREIYLRGFEIAVREGGAKAVMTSYNRINGVYTADSYDLCTKVLRNEWGFEGVVMTDWFSTARGQGDTALAMHAGNDLIMPGGAGFKQSILNGVKKGVIAREDVERCCGNVLLAILNSAIQKEYIK
ncbi:MAG: glycoside hydrolase family 3 C-terminal domain-containing protein [Oscillospiraceae bacterium]|nr:glycoside hydrolase family 3 C-terminal domain-containing protein [Oscillospiraceae bacterium]